MGCDWHPLQCYSQFFDPPEKGTFVNTKGSGSRIPIVIVFGECIYDQLGLGGLDRIIIFVAAKVGTLG